MASNNNYQANPGSSIQKGKKAQKPGTKSIIPTSDNEDGQPGAQAQQDSSNKGKGPAGENL
jgi:hypothetical protein